MKTRHSVVVNDAPRSDVGPSAHGRSIEPLTDPSNDSEAVQRILRRLSDDLGASRLERLFDHATAIHVDNGRLDVTVPTGFSAEWLDRKFGTALRRAAEAEIGTTDTLDPADPAKTGVTLHFQVAPTSARPGSNAAGAETAEPTSSASSREARPPRAASQQPIPRRAAQRQSLRYRFDDFVVGASNRLAYSAALQVAEDEAGAAPAPLFIHGGCGLGKTHLLQALANRYLERHPGASVRCLTAEIFTNDYITAVRHSQIDAFRRTYRGLDLLCLDDVHFLSSKEKTQNELLHTFDAINLSHARVVLASDGHPRDIQRLSEGLVSRFMSGVVVRLDPPDAELRERIIAHLAQRRGLALDPAAIKLIAEHSARGGGSVREMEGLLLRVDAVQRLLPEFTSTTGVIGIVAVRKALGLDGPAVPGAAGVARARRPIQISVIIAEACRALQVDPSDLGGRGRHKRVVMARSLISYLARRLTTLSFPEIARALSRPNHSTVITAYQRVLAHLESRGHEDLGPELGVEFTGVGLADLAERLSTAVTKASDPR